MRTSDRVIAGFGFCCAILAILGGFFVLIVMLLRDFA